MGDFDLSGDMEGIREMAKKIMLIGAPETREKVLAEMSDWALAQVEQEFAMAHDPYGMPWAPLKRPRPGGGILTRTNHMRPSVQRKFVGDGFKLVSDVFYSRFHQHGTRKMVRRQVLPGKIPEAWRQELVRIADAALKRVLGEVV